MTDEQIQAWADEAEAGYDLSKLPKPRRGRPPVGDGPGEVVPVRLDAATIAALTARAEAEGPIGGAVSISTSSGIPAVAGAARGAVTCCSAATSKGTSASATSGRSTAASARESAGSAAAAPPRVLIATATSSAVAAAPAPR